MKNYIAQPLESTPGIQRDGTPFASQSYIDGQWVRFYMGKPRKIGGYEAIFQGNDEIIRTLFNVPQPNAVNTYIGRQSSVGFIKFDYNGGQLTTFIDRTPVGFVSNPNNVWTFDVFTSSDEPGKSIIVAQVAPNSNDVSNTLPGAVYWGYTNDIAPLQQITQNNGAKPPLIPVNLGPITSSGGIVFAPPFMLGYGADGLIQWSEEGEIENWNSQRTLTINNSSIVKMLRARGSTAPVLLAWTLDSLVNVSYTIITNEGGTEGSFTQTTLQDGISIMSAECVINYNQQFFWIGIDQFYVFNGIVQQLPNTMSSDWFFENVDLKHRAKIWGMAIPRYKELWWFYPTKINGELGIGECTNVIIYNTELQVWYDSVLSRAAGVSPGTFPLPLMADSIDNLKDGYHIWRHEYGYNKVDYDGEETAIPSYFETHIMALFNASPENNRLLRTRRLEPDFRMSGDMTVTVKNRMFAQDPDYQSTGPFTFNATIPKIDNLTSQGRLVSFVFESNEIGGAYQMGKPILDYEIGDVNP